MERPADACTPERFLLDVANHTMEVKVDNGLYKHLTFSNNGSCNGRFHLTTCSICSICSICGEYLEGDGYQVVLHCPNADEDQVACAEPDANPIECQNPEAENAQANPDRPV